MNSTAFSERPRRGWRRCLAGIATVALGCGFALAAAAEEVRVMSAAAFQPVLTAITPAFEKRTGHKLRVVNAPPAELAERIRAGEHFDLAVLPQDLLEVLGQEAEVAEGSIVAIARAGAAAQGPAVYAGAVSTGASSSQGALSLLILLASEQTQAILPGKGFSAP